jgi:hypothetical protein
VLVDDDLQAEEQTVSIQKSAENGENVTDVITALISSDESDDNHEKSLFVVPMSVEQTPSRNHDVS